MTPPDIVEEITLERDSEREQMIQLDGRGRVTIPSSIRSRHGIDPTDDKEYWAEITIESIEVRDPKGGDGSE